MPHPESGETPALLSLTSSSLYLCPFFRILVSSSLWPILLSEFFSSLPPSLLSSLPLLPLPPSHPPSPHLTPLFTLNRNKCLPGTCKLLATSHPPSFTHSPSFTPSLLHTLPPSHPLSHPLTFIPSHHTHTHSSSLLHLHTPSLLHTLSPSHY